MSLVDAQLQTEISKSVAGLPYFALARRLGRQHHPRHGPPGLPGGIHRQGGSPTPRATSSSGRSTTSASEPHVFRGTERSGKVRVAHLARRRAHDGHPPGRGARTLGRRARPALFAGYDCLYVEGYLVQDHALIRGAVQTAKACGLQVAIDLASFNIVDENRDFLRALVAEHVDILFANEDEAKAPSPARRSRSTPCKASRSCARSPWSRSARAAH